MVNILDAILIGSAIFSCIFSILSVIIGCVAMLKVMAIEKSTHKVQFIPTEAAKTLDPFNTRDNDYNEKESEEKWGLTEKDVDKINKNNLEDTNLSDLSI